MAYALERVDQAFTHDEIVSFLRKRIGDHLLDVTEEYGTFTLHVDAEGYVEAARILYEEERLGFTMFDCLFGVDAREEGFDVVAVLHAPAYGTRVLLRHRCEGGRDEPVAPTLTHLFEGANWMEREAWDMFGIEFDDHPGLAPRILCVENMEGWPLRKDFHLASRAAKPWPGVKEPVETDEEGNIIRSEPAIGDAPGPTDLDEAMAAQAKLANPGPEPDEPVDGEEGEVLAGETGQVEEDVEENVEEAASEAREVAEEKRRAAAEARARKAAERAAEAGEDAPPVQTPAEDGPEVPEGQAGPETDDGDGDDGDGEEEP